MTTTAPTITINAAANLVTIAGQFTWTNVRDGIFLARTVTPYRIDLTYRGSPFDPAFVSPLAASGGEAILPVTASVQIGDPKTTAAFDSATNLRLAIYAAPPGAPDDGTPRFGIYSEPFVRTYVAGSLDGDQEFQLLFGFDESFDRFERVTAGMRVRTPVIGGAESTDLYTVEDYRGDNDFPSQSIGGSPEQQGGPGVDRLTGTGGNDTLRGLGGNDVLAGLAGNDLLDGGLGTDTADYRAASRGVAVDLGQTGAQATGGAGTDTLRSIENLLGSRFADRLSGNGDANRFDGGRGNDVLDGSGGNDVLLGGAGDDRLVGGQGNDLLQGGAGADQLDGGAGRDRFVFASAADSAGRAVDRIQGFDAPGAAIGDVIDLRGIDAIAGTPRNDAFTFGSTARGGLSVVERNGETIVRGNLDRDPAFEFVLRIVDGPVPASSYTASDFLL